MKKTTPQPSIAEVARQRLGFESLRPGQEEAVQAILDRHDTLVVQPTGSGKSAIYQIAGLLIEGSTIIVSPLIALQKDQVEAIAQQDSADAVAVNSTQPLSELRKSMEKIEQGKFEYVFLAPEQLGKPETVETLRAAKPSLFVVDEAHCISEWGHNFRPEYLRLGSIIEELGHPRVVALTATGTARVREEILTRLRMRRPKVFVRGFDRPNIHLRVDQFETETEKRDALVHRARWAEKPGIIYTATRKAAEEIMGALQAAEIPSLYYHGGMKAADRHRVQECFMSGDSGIMVATNAFGMGVDKPDIRFVYHYDAPDSLDSYYQEIGRAGRDGGKSEAVLFYRRQDIAAQRFKTGEGKMDVGVLQDLAARIAEARGAVRPEAIAKELGLSRRKLATALQRLEDAGAIETLRGSEVRALPGINPGAAAQAAAGEQEERRQGKRDRLEKMQEYAETSSCRRQVLLDYLGDEFAGPCRFCDNCEGTANQSSVDPKEGTRREVV